MSFKRLFAVAILAVMTVSVSAQDFKKFRFGPTVGLNVATTTSAEVSSRVGFQVGALGEYNFNDNFFLLSAVKFSQKGGKFAGGGGSFNPYYIEIPLHGGYRYNFNDKFSLFGEFGPYIGIGVCGKISEDGEPSINYFGNEGMEALGAKAKRFDFGLGLAAGAEYSNFQLRLGYDFGLTKLYDVVGSAKNRNFYIALSYMF